MFLRSIGSAVGVAVFGAIANAIFHAAGSQDAPTTTTASVAVFIAVVAAGLLTLLAAVLMPQVRAESAEPASAAATDDSDSDVDEAAVDERAGRRTEAAEVA